jgi:hypothetical protein
LLQVIYALIKLPQRILESHLVIICDVLQPPFQSTLIDLQYVYSSAVNVCRREAANVVT